MSDDKIVLPAWNKTGKRHPDRVRTLNVGDETWNRVRFIRSQTGLDYDTIVKMALDELDKKITLPVVVLT